MFYTTSGSKVSIGGALAMKATDFLAADFTSQTWVEVGEVESIGALGDTFASVTFDSVAAARSRTGKGIPNAGTMELVVALDPADAGQTALLAALKATGDYAFKIEFNDKPASGASPKNSTRMFIGKVMAVTEALGSGSDVMKRNVTLAINSNVVAVNASAT